MDVGRSHIGVGNLGLPANLGLKGVCRFQWAYSLAHDLLDLWSGGWQEEGQRRYYHFNYLVININRKGVKGKPDIISQSIWGDSLGSCNFTFPRQPSVTRGRSPKMGKWTHKQ